MPVRIANALKRYGLRLCLPLSLSIIGLAVALPVYAGSQVVGHISFAKGSNAAQQPGAAPRILGKDAEIFQGDNIQTTERSFVIIEFTDGAKVTVRPDSNFTIDHYDNQSANKTAQLVLHQGSVNANTGDIAKDNPESFQIKTPTATIKPESKKAEFNVGICDKECEDRSKKEAEANAVRTEKSPVARVVEIKGEVSAINRADKNAKERPLSLGNAVYNSDSISSEQESYALLLFPDGQKITLKASSEMDIKQYNYQIKDKKDQVLLRLATGGLRALTGSIGKADHGAYTLDTPVATIGIRGSGSDTDTDGSNLKQETWKDATFVRTQDNTEYDVREGQTLSMKDPSSTPQIYNTPPSSPKPNDPPRPDANKSDPKDVFKEKPAAAKGDTRVTPISGNAGVQNSKGEKTSVKEGETGSTNKNGETKTAPVQPNDTTHNNNPSGNNPAANDGSFNSTTDDSADGC
ncbi:MAG: FecR domain-containing protein [Methylobacter sp.]|nr:FecR domain-containing protein [Methylobacter sp.]